MSDLDEDIVRGCYAMMTEPRQVTAVMRFRGGPGREAEAARAWAFELTYYFTRGVGEQPVVSYENGIYTVTGLMQTTHPHDHEVNQDFASEPYPEIDFILSPERQETLRNRYPRAIMYDGRER